MVKQSKVKSYTRNGKTVRSYDRSIKDTVRQIGSVVGAGLGGLAAVKYGKRVPFDKFVLGALGGALLGGVPARLVNKDNKKAKQQLKSAATIGGGIAGLGLATLGGVKGYKFLKARNTKSLALYDPLIAEKTALTNANINLNKAVKRDLNSMPKTVNEAVSSMSFNDRNFIINWEKDTVNKNKLGMLGSRMKRHDNFQLLSPNQRKAYIDITRIMNDKAVVSREDLYTSVIENTESLFKDPTAIKNYKAIVKAMSDTSISSAERKAYQAQLQKYKTQVNPSKTINKLKELGFRDIDIKEMKDKYGSEGLFYNVTKLNNF